MEKFKNIDLLKITTLFIILVLFATPTFAQFDFMDDDEDEVEYLDEDSCVECHNEEEHDVDFEWQIEESIHEGFGCLECHPYYNTDPHSEDMEFSDGCEGCASCHEEEYEEYKGHGRSVTGECEELPSCADCHGGHTVLPSDDEESLVHPKNLPYTCGVCHEDIDLTEKYQILINHPLEIYETSVHAQAVRDGNEDAPTCNDCHSSSGTAHQIYHPGNIESKINDYNRPIPCGKSHEEQENDH